LLFTQYFSEWTQLIDTYNVPGVSVALIKKGVLSSAKCYGVLQKGRDEIIDQETMFSVGSVSKVVAAVIILKLVEEGKLDLDKNINEYLNKWKIEDTNFTKENPVTLRRIMSHTARVYSTWICRLFTWRISS